MGEFDVRPIDISQGMQALTSGIQQGRENDRLEEQNLAQQELQTRAGEILQSGDPAQISQFMIEHPSLASTMQTSMEANRSMKKGESLDLIGQIVGGVDPVRALGERAQLISQRGGNPQDTLQLMETFKTNPEQGMQEIERQYSFLDPQGYQSFMKSQGREVKKSSPSTDIDDYVADAEAQYLIDNPDKEEMPPGKRNEARRNFKRAQADERRDVVRGEKTVAGEEARASDLITRGLASAESTATIRRAIDLLDTVETGGIDNANLAAKRFFGVEGADEGELSGALGKAVLSQLRETFGAAFTQEEGNRLIRIEAGFGKSPETNKRLLNQSLRIANRTAQRALKSAKTRGDQATIDDITELLEFSLSGEPEAQYTEGQTATGANGERLIFRNGNWGPM